MIKSYSHDEHFEIFKKWNDARFQYGVEAWMLPDLGFVCNDNAMAFLVTTNSPVAWLGNWIVNPDCSREERKMLIGELIVELEKVAKEKGFKLTQTLGMVGLGLSEILKSYGYSSTDGEYSFFVKDIRR